MSLSGHELRDNNEKIIKYLTKLRNARKEMHYLIEKQETEKVHIENELEKLSFKLTLLVKSLGQRTQARGNYDKTISEIENRYHNLVDESGKLLNNITKEVELLDEIMDKKIGTSPATSKQPSAQLQKESPPPSPPKQPSITKESSRSSSIQKSISPQQSPRHSVTSKEASKESTKESSKGSSSIHKEPSLSSERKPSGVQKSTPPKSPRTSYGKTLDTDDFKKFVGNNSRDSFLSESINDNEELPPEQPNPHQRKRDSIDMSEVEEKSVALESTLDNFFDMPDKVIDEEVQSFREAYGRQHMPSFSNKKPS